MTTVPIQRPFFLLLSIACPALAARAEVVLRPIALHKAVAVRSASASAVEAVSGSTDNAVQAARVRELLAGYGPLLEILPLADLLRANFADGELRLEFNFGGKQSRQVKLAAKEQWVLDKEGRACRRKSKARTLRVKRELRFQFGAKGIESVHAGDLEVKWGLFFLDLSMSTERTDEREVRNEGRVVLETELDGSPVKQAGAVVPCVASRWVVLEAQGRRVEIPIESPEATAAPVLAVAATTRPPTTASVAARVSHHCLNSIARLWTPRTSGASRWSSRNDWRALASLDPSFGGID